MRRRVIFLVLALLACLCFCLPASADGTAVHGSITVDRGVDPASALEDSVPLNADYNRWQDEQGQPIQRVPAEYDGMTDYTLPTYLLESESAQVDFASPRDFGGNETVRIICRANAALGSTARFALELTLFAGEEKMTASAALPINLWCAVDLDIGSWQERDAMTRIEMRLVCTNGEETADLQFAHLRVDEPMDAELRERFLTDSFEARGGKVFLSPGAEMGYLVATDSSPMLTATVLVPRSETETNALRFVFDNETACRSITLQYAYSPDGANARSLSHEVGEGRQICLFEVPDAARVRYIRIMFTGAKEGLITLRALNAVSTYENGIEHLGTVTACAVSDDSREIHVRGTVAHDIMIANRENRLALFVLNAWETVDGVLTDGRAPDATADISIRFAFTLPFAEGDYAALGASYLVAIQSGSEAEGYTYIPIADPSSLAVPADDASAAAGGAIKGVQTELVSTAGQAGASIYLVDVYLDRLCDGSAAGYRYTGGADNLYLDREVLDALDEAVRLRSAAGEAVYLRLLLSDDGTAVNYAIAPDAAAQGAARGILLANDAARDTIGAITEFLTSRYTGGDAGRIAGFIVGRQVDDAAAHNDIGQYSLADYVDHYADLLTLIANTARRQNAALQVIVPISDRRPAECITADLLENSYDSELFLRSLFKRLDDLNGPAVSLMLESAHNPFSLVDGVLAELEEDEPDEPDTADETARDYYNADDLGDFSALVDSMSSIYASMPSTFLYCWTPAADTGDALSAAYAYLYYRLRFSTHADAFIVSFAEAEAAGNMGGMTQLRHLMRYIDTDRSLEVSELALAVFGVDSWQTLIDEFDPAKLAGRTLYEGELIASPGTAHGRYVYWDFTTSYSTRGWYAGTHMGSLSVRGSGASRALAAEFDRAAAETGAYSEIIYHFEAAEPLALLDRMAFDLCVEGGGVWEISITAGFGQNTRLEQKQVVEAGQRMTLCLTTSALGIEKADYLKLCAKPVSGSGEGKLCLYTVTGESDSLSDDALAARLHDLRSLAAAEIDDGASSSSLAWVFIVCAVVIFTLTIAVILGRRQDEELAREKQAKK